MPDANMGRNDRLARWAGLLAPALAWMLVAGCDAESSSPPTVMVRGQVTLDGGPWPFPGILTFEPVGHAGDLEWIGVAAFGADGNFGFVSGVRAEGLRPGHYKVTVSCWRVEPKSRGDGVAEDGDSVVPAAYLKADTTPLSLTVRPDDGETVVRFDVNAR